MNKEVVILFCRKEKSKPQRLQKRKPLSADILFDMWICHNKKDLSYSTISEKYNCSKNTVKTWLDELDMFSRSC